MSCDRNQLVSRVKLTIQVRHPQNTKTPHKLFPTNRKTLSVPRVALEGSSLICLFGGWKKWPKNLLPKMVRFSMVIFIPWNRIRKKSPTKQIQALESLTIPQWSLRFRQKCPRHLVSPTKSLPNLHPFRRWNQVTLWKPRMPSQPGQSTNGSLVVWIPIGLGVPIESQTTGSQTPSLPLVASILFNNNGRCQPIPLCNAPRNSRPYDQGV